MPAGLQDRRVEITGPTDRKMVINALNSGARGFMADFEDANSPTWANMIGGQANLIDAVRGTIEHSEGGKRLPARRRARDAAGAPARPAPARAPPDGRRRAGRRARFFDFGLYVFHNARELLERGSGPVLLPAEARVAPRGARCGATRSRSAEDELGLERGTIKATVLIETLPAAFEMDAILHELRDHAAGLNAGRWDYIFSTIKRFRQRPDFVLPDRSEVKMTVPFMRAYTELLVKTCHRRGAHAMGGMAAVIPSRKDPEANERAYAAVREDKRREAGDGLRRHLGRAPRLGGGGDGRVRRGAGRAAEPGRTAARRRRRLRGRPAGRRRRHRVEITEAGLRSNVNVGIQYISSWLRGNGAAAIYGLMEDAATAEISRSQVWQWIRHGVQLEDGRTVTPELVRAIAESRSSSGSEGRSATTNGSRPRAGRASRERCSSRWR